MRRGKVRIDNLLKMLGCQSNDVSREVLAEFASMDTDYHEANLSELEEYVSYVSELTRSNIKRTKGDNLKAFEKGWEENLQHISSGDISMDNLKPKYFRGSKFLRFNNKLIVTSNLELEYDLFTIARHLLFSKYLSPFQNIYELGCGSCQNLLMLSDMFPSKELHGFDWSESSIKIVKLLSKSRNISGKIFDMFNPPTDTIIKPNSAIFTIHSMEQLGSKYGILLAFIMEAKPSIVIHYEPILEFYDRYNQLDYLATCYCQERNYLSGYWNTLRNLQERKKVEIITAIRPYIGGVIHEASLVVWRPI